MNILSKLFSFRKQASSGIFNFITSNIFPDLKSREFKAAYRGWVFASISAIAEAFGTIELRLQKKTADGWEEVTDHAALDLLHKINFLTSPYEFWVAVASWIKSHGETFWYLVPNLSGKKPVEIWLLDPSRVTVVKDKTQIVSGYKYVNEDGTETAFHFNQILHIKTFNPEDPFRGMSTIKAAALSIDTDHYAATYNRNFFLNSAVPGLALETESKLTPEQVQQIRDQWYSRHKGSDKAHEMAVLHSGLKINNLSLTQKDMDYLEQRRFSRDEILAMFRVNKHILGITEDVNRANAEAANVQFAQWVIKPLMELVVSQLNEKLLPLFGEDSTKMRFAYKDPVPENVELELKRKESGIRNGYYTINEVRAEEGLPPVEGGDLPYIASSSLPVGEAAQPTPPAKSAKKKSVTKNFNVVEKRTKFVVSEIRKRKKQFKKLLKDRKEILIERLSEQKSIKKDKAGDLVRLLFSDLNEWVGILYNATFDSLETSVAFAGKQALDQLEIDLTFNLENPRVQDWLNDNALEHAKSVANTVKDEVAIIIQEGVEAGSSIKDISDGISGFFAKESDWRAERIARTEVISGYAEGNLEGFKQSEVVRGKSWLTAGDGDVDDLCTANEEQGMIDLDKTFESGHDAPPSHPNCRCTLVPEV